MRVQHKSTIERIHVTGVMDEIETDLEKLRALGYHNTRRGPKMVGFMKCDSRWYQVTAERVVQSVVRPKKGEWE
jgi:hypothetical protein